uniref:Uncharacterized protein n=1 Tax=Anguilla anguilla TaxID=7936 RepID=A0A0E9RNL2_ANGAN
MISQILTYNTAQYLYCLFSTVFVCREEYFRKYNGLA